MKPDNSHQKFGYTPEDRRVKRTRESLKRAFKELVFEQGFEDLKLQDILKKADVGKSSFYSHFKNKEDLLLQILDDLEVRFDTSSSRAGHEFKIQEFSLKMFQHLERNRRLAKVLFGHSRLGFVRQHVHNMIFKFYRKELSRNESRSGREIDVTATMVAGALVSLATLWLASQDPLSPEEIHQIFTDHMNLL